MQEKKNLQSGQLHNDLSGLPQVAMENACFIGRMDKLKELLELYAQSSNLLHQEWVRVYKLFYRRNILEITPEALLNSVQYQTSDDPELFIAYRILHAYASYDEDDYGVLRSICKTLIKDIKKIEGSQIEPLYNYRLSQLLSVNYLRENNVDKAREEAQFIIDNCSYNSYVISSYHTLGISFLYEDYEKGMTALETGLKLSLHHKQKRHMNELRRGIIFFNNYWEIDGKYILFTNQLRDHTERAHFELRRGNRAKAQEIIEKVDLHSLTLNEQGYYFFYKGLASDNIDFFFKSIESFKKTEDKFFSNMARLELYRRGERQAAIEAAYN